MTAGTLPPYDEGSVRDFLHDFVMSEASIHYEFYGRGSSDWFPITVRKLGPVYFIKAQSIVSKN